MRSGLGRFLVGRHRGSRHFCFQNVIPWVFFVTGLMVEQRKTSVMVWLSIMRNDPAWHLYLYRQCVVSLELKNADLALFSCLLT